MKSEGTAGQRCNFTQGVAPYTPAANSTLGLRFERQMIDRSCVHLRPTD